jgi:hypothetical protein
MVQNHHEILVSLCSKNSTVSYDLLMSALGIGTERELEDFIIQAIYQDIIQVSLSIDILNSFKSDLEPEKYDLI